jgi:hypothetical protein
MPFSWRLLSKAGLFAFGLLVVIAVTALAFGFRVYQRKSAAITAAVSAPAQTSKERIPTVGVTLTRFGFQPAAIKVAEGKSLLVVRNISGADKFQLELAEVRGQKLVVEKPKEEKRFWEKPLHLKAGEYTLSVTENPRWSLALTVVAAEKK